MPIKKIVPPTQEQLIAKAGAEWIRAQVAQRANPSCEVANAYVKTTKDNLMIARGAVFDPRWRIWR